MFFSRLLSVVSNEYALQFTFINIRLYKLALIVLQIQNGFIHLQPKIEEKFD